ncbi:oxidoreductase, short chain dehydrogenase [Sporothrix brasiliensis 5110]|uniref:Oxidoreductase, short chain dehydrogenase n=1 Tax=Sporothrix brasiliensis 5110 TaxID=1398154 RepID=A0A0C2ENS6_9PEZI|nr:oxidoreductase, short chain dehydrogenase [Sporothrix brasiliensis 5110]KIH87784.1 oxidoreductase, short chain dehydrogenase [Sporothrix brasiliensis 5110]
MTAIPFSRETLNALSGKVVVLTGGAQGVGAATVQLVYEAGAHVFFGDWADDKGRSLAASVQKDVKSVGSGSVTFQKVDVREYASQLALFDAAYKAHGRVDVAVSCAAVSEPAGFFEPENLDLESVKQVSTTITTPLANIGMASTCLTQRPQEPTELRSRLDINLTSVLLFSRMALAYMKASPQDGTSRSMVLVSSIAGITEAPGLFAYSTAKHGVIGLMRALRPYAPRRYGVRVNAICPWATDTQLLAGVVDTWVQEALPLNQPSDVAGLILQCAADATLNGKAVLVAGGTGYDTEEGYDKTQAQWMGEQLSAEFNRGQRVLGLGDGWTN